MTRRGAQPGVDHPDGRGRIGLDQAGRDLTGNPDVIIRDVEVTSDGWHVLRRTTFDTTAGATDNGSPCSARPMTAATAPPFWSTTPTAAPSCSLTEEGEDIEILELAYADALRMIADGLIADGKTIMLLYWAAIDGPFTDAV
jgi:hypothetical protein